MAVATVDRNAVQTCLPLYSGLELSSANMPASVAAP
jgi:hypothetical protein